MARLVMKIGVGIVAVAILAFLLFTGVPMPQATQIPKNDRTFSGVVPQPLSAAEVQVFLERFDPDLTDLTRARGNLLFKAAQEPLDMEGVRIAATTYRDAIHRIRTKVAALEHELGPDDSRMMMYHATGVSRRILELEIYGELGVAQKGAP